VAVINETMARRYFHGRNPLGARFAYGRGEGASPDIEIVGVVADSKASSVAEADVPFVYEPYLQHPALGRLTFFVRSRQDPAALASTIREVLGRIDPQIPVYGLKTLPAQISESLVTERLLVLLSSAFGALAALLAALGIYGVLAYAVAQRRQEIGVRMALGADPAAVRRLVLAEVGRFLLAGAAIGLPAAYLVGRLVESMLFGVGAADTRVFLAGLLLMTVVSIAAAFPPARRAARTNPIEALRSD
jgi:predicted lysophospholipase L1 biosynthesis ABC-type transport system permease subunit